MLSIEFSEALDPLYHQRLFPDAQQISAKWLGRGDGLLHFGVWLKSLSSHAFLKG